MRGNDSGTVYSERGMWVARLPRPLGRGRLGSYPTQQKAAQVLAAFLQSLVEDPTMPTVDRWGRHWLAQRIAAGTHKEGQDDVRRWKLRVGGSSLAPLPLDAVTPSDVREWLGSLRTRPTKSEPEGRKVGAQTARNALSLLRCAFDAACYAGHLDTLCANVT